MVVGLFYNPSIMVQVSGASGRFFHPFSQLARSDSHPVTFVSGQGATLTDSEDFEYVDATAALWFTLIGHGREEMADAIAAQVRTLEACSCFDVFASDRTLELTERVAQMVPFENPSVFFTSGGSDSVETAAKLSRRYWLEQGSPDKRVIIAREGAYHGTHGFGTSLAGIEANREGFGPLIEETALIPRFDAGALDEQITRLGEERVAAFIVEPVIGAGGVYPPPPGYLPKIAEICQARNVLLIADEVVTGFGRTGSLFACQRYGINPDIMVLAKGLTSGYLPLGATILSDRLIEPFARPDSPWIRHGYTYSGHATACAAALKNLEIIDREGLVERVSDLEQRFAANLGELAEEPGISEVRTVGLTAAVQLDESWPDQAANGLQVVDECRRRGVLTRLLAGGSLHVSPPFVISESQIDLIIEAISGATQAVSGSPIVSTP